MKTVSLATIGYSPATPPSDQSELPRYLYDELLKIQAAIQSLADGHLDVSYAAPSKPRDGDIRYADGTTWNPGSGKGMYRYNGSTWTLLG